MASNGVLLQAENITKLFAKVVALKDAYMDIRKNEIVGLVGGNAAGKSTLVKILAGVLKKDGGDIYIRGKKVNIDSPKTARKLGIEVVFQELALAPNRNVFSNVFLGRGDECLKQGRFFKTLGVVDNKKMMEISKNLLKQLGMHIDTSSIVMELSGGERHSVAIARSLLSNPQIILMDEPTAGLSIDATNRCLKLIKKLKDTGLLSVLIVSHSIDQISRICDRVVVLREGRTVMSKKMSETNKKEIISQMFGLKA